jgi:hypothetical protein
MRLLPISATIFALLITVSACKQTGNKPISNTQTDTLTPAKPVIDTPLADIPIDTLSNIDPIEKKIIDTLFKVPQVIAEARYMEEHTKGERPLKIWVAGRPQDTGERYYWIKAGEDNDAALVTHFNFHIYPDSMRIMYYDIVDDQEITLKEWEKKEAGKSKSE